MVQNEGKNVPQCEPQNVPQTEPQGVPQCEPQSVPINKHKQNKTKTETPPIPPAEHFEEFFSAYPKDSNRHLTEVAYIGLLLTGKVTEDELVQCAVNYAEACRIEKMQYIYNAENFLKKFVFEQYMPGKYRRPEPKRANNFNNFPQHDYDFEQLEKELLDN